MNLIGREEFSNLIGGSQSGLLYVLSGYAVFALSNYSWQSNSKVESEMVMGTLKTNFLLPINKTSYIYGLSIGNIFTTGIVSLVILIGVILYSRLSSLRIMLFIILFLLSILTFLGISLIVSSISLAFKKIGGLTNIVTFILQIVTGMMIPIRVFPKSIQLILKRMPTSIAIDSIRSLLLNLQPLDSLRNQIFMLLGYSIILNLTGYILCEKAIKKSKIDGILDVY